jgi:hypothetical protein
MPPLPRHAFACAMTNIALSIKALRSAAHDAIETVTLILPTCDHLQPRDAELQCQ